MLSTAMRWKYDDYYNQHADALKALGRDAFLTLIEDLIVPLEEEITKVNDNADRLLTERDEAYCEIATLSAQVTERGGTPV